MSDLSGYFYAIENFADNLFGSHIVGLGLVAKTDAVTQYVVTYGTYILGDNITAHLQEGIGTSGQGQVDRGTR
jgi:hypothetical protein